MHDEAHRYVAEQVGKRGPFVSVLEVGSRDINGSVRSLFDEHDTVFEGVDIVAGPGVDCVCDATQALPRGPYDAVVATEVFEHCRRWPLIVRNAYGALMGGGVLIVTMAGPGRLPHSAVDGGRLQPDEWYRNVDPRWLDCALRVVGFEDVDVDVMGVDVRATAAKGAS